MSLGPLSTLGEDLGYAEEQSAEARRLQSTLAWVNSDSAAEYTTLMASYPTLNPDTGIGIVQSGFNADMPNIGEILEFQNRQDRSWFEQHVYDPLIVGGIRNATIGIESVYNSMPHTRGLRAAVGIMQGMGISDAIEQSEGTYLSQIVQAARAGVPWTAGEGYFPQPQSAGDSPEYREAFMAEMERLTAGRGGTPTAADIQAAHRAGVAAQPYDIAKGAEEAAGRITHQSWLGGPEIPISIGGLLTAQFMRPGTVPYTIMSGMLDTPFRLGLDPANVPFWEFEAFKHSRRLLRPINQATEAGVIPVTAAAAPDLTGVGATLAVSPPPTIRVGRDHFSEPGEFFEYFDRVTKEGTPAEISKVQQALEDNPEFDAVYRTWNTQRTAQGDRPYEIPGQVEDPMIIAEADRQNRIPPRPDVLNRARMQPHTQGVDPIMIVDTPMSEYGGWITHRGLLNRLTETEEAYAARNLDQVGDRSLRVLTDVDREAVYDIVAQGPDAMTGANSQLVTEFLASAGPEDHAWFRARQAELEARIDAGLVAETKARVRDEEIAATMRWFDESKDHSAEAVEAHELRIFDLENGLAERPVVDGIDTNYTIPDDVLPPDTETFGGFRPAEPVPELTAAEKAGMRDEILAEIDREYPPDVVFLDETESEITRARFVEEELQRRMDLRTEAELVTRGAALESEMMPPGAELFRGVRPEPGGGVEAAVTPEVPAQAPLAEAPLPPEPVSAVAGTGLEEIEPPSRAELAALEEELTPPMDQAGYYEGPPLRPIKGLPVQKPTRTDIPEGISIKGNVTTVNYEHRMKVKVGKKTVDAFWVSPDRGQRRILITGSRKRDWFNPTEAKRRIRELIRQIHELDPEAIIVHGAADGIDSWADEAAQELGMLVERHPVTGENWNRHGLKAGMDRNAMMLTAGVHEVFAFPVPASKGTKGMVDMSQAYGVPTTVFKLGDEPVVTALSTKGRFDPKIMLGVAPPKIADVRIREWRRIIDEYLNGPADLVDIGPTRNPEQLEHFAGEYGSFGPDSMISFNEQFSPYAQRIGKSGKVEKVPGEEIVRDAVEQILDHSSEGRWYGGPESNPYGMELDEAKEWVEEFVDYLRTRVDENNEVSISDIQTLLGRRTNDMDASLAAGRAGIDPRERALLTRKIKRLEGRVTGEVKPLTAEEEGTLAELYEELADIEAPRQRPDLQKKLDAATRKAKRLRSELADLVNPRERVGLEEELRQAETQLREMTERLTGRESTRAGQEVRYQIDQLEARKQGSVEGLTPTEQAELETMRAALRDMEWVRPSAKKFYEIERKARRRIDFLKSKVLKGDEGAELEKLLTLYDQFGGHHPVKADRLAETRSGGFTHKNVDDLDANEKFLREKQGIVLGRPEDEKIRFRREVIPIPKDTILPAPTDQNIERITTTPITEHRLRTIVENISQQWSLRPGVKTPASASIRSQMRLELESRLGYLQDLSRRLKARFHQGHPETVRMVHASRAAELKARPADTAKFGLTKLDMAEKAQKDVLEVLLKSKDEGLAELVLGRMDKTEGGLSLDQIDLDEYRIFHLEGEVPRENKYTRARMEMWRKIGLRGEPTPPMGAAAKRPGKIKIVQPEPQMGGIDLPEARRLLQGRQVEASKEITRLKRAAEKGEKVAYSLADATSERDEMARLLGMNDVQLNAYIIAGETPLPPDLPVQMADAREHLVEDLATGMIREIRPSDIDVNELRRFLEDTHAKLNVHGGDQKRTYLTPTVEPRSRWRSGEPGPTRSSCRRGSPPVEWRRSGSSPPSRVSWSPGRWRGRWSASSTCPGTCSKSWRCCPRLPPS